MNRWDAKYSRMEDTKDEELVGVLRESGDQEEIDIAEKVLHNRYQPRILLYVWKMTESDDAEDLAQEIWLRVFAKAKSKGSKKIEKFERYLFTTAHNHCIDYFRRRKTEIEIESDIPITEYIGTSDGDGILEYVENKEQRQLLHQLSFTAPLSDCQRVIWVLRGLHNYSASVVGKLLGKRKTTINTHFHDANERMKEYLRNTYRGTGDVSLNAEIQKPRLVIERFANPVSSQLMVGDAVASLILPWRHGEEEKCPNESKSLGLILTKRSYWEAWHKAITWLSLPKGKRGRYPGGTVLDLFYDLLVPKEVEEYVRVDIDGEDIILTPVENISFVPGEVVKGSFPSIFPDEEKTPDLSHMYFAVHSTMKRKVFVAIASLELGDSFDRDYDTLDQFERGLSELQPLSPSPLYSHYI